MSEEKLKKIWQEVELERDKFLQEFAYKNFYSGSKKDLILIGIDKDSSKGIMIRDESGRNALPKLSSSFQIERYFIEEKKSSFITIFCKENSLDEPFTYLISLIIKNIDYGLSPTLATKEAIEKFQRLFKSFGKLPPENQIVGLLGELFFVDQIIKIKNDYWKGWIKPEKIIMNHLTTFYKRKKNRLDELNKLGWEMFVRKRVMDSDGRIRNMLVDMVSKDVTLKKSFINRNTLFPIK